MAACCELETRREPDLLTCRGLLCNPALLGKQSKTTGEKEYTHVYTHITPCGMSQPISTRTDLAIIHTQTNQLPQVSRGCVGSSVSICTRTGAAEVLVLLLSICLHFSISLSSLNLSVSLQRENSRIFKSSECYRSHRGKNTYLQPSWTFTPSLCIHLRWQLASQVRNCSGYRLTPQIGPFIAACCDVSWAALVILWCSSHRLYVSGLESTH